MEKKKLTEIIEIFKASGLGKMELSETEAEKTFTLKLERNADVIAAPAPVLPPLPAASAAGKDAAESAPAPQDIKDYNKYRDIRSPMVGIFYAAPAPDAEPFVKVGKKVKKGDTLCVIEAMKLMNDVVAEEDGEIVEICADNGALVEFGQVLFKIF